MFSASKLWFIHCNCGNKSFYCDSRPPFLISSTVSISPLELSSWTPLVICFIHILQYHIACLHLLACVLRFACRKSFLGEVNQVVLGWWPTEQWCSGCRVRILLIWSRIVNVEISTNRTYPYLSENRAYSSSSGIRVRLLVRYYRIFSF